MADKNEIAIKSTTPMFHVDLSVSDMSGLTEEERQQLQGMMDYEMMLTAEGVQLQPVRIKINKEMCVFYDPTNQTYDKIVGTILYKTPSRSFFRKKKKFPQCTCQDIKAGQATWWEDWEERKGTPRSCKGCEYGAWGSAVNDDDTAGKGKACKETRRLFLARPGSLLPIAIDLPPTSIKPFEVYESTRAAQNMPDIVRQVSIRLEKTTKGGYDTAIARFENGPANTGKEMIALMRMREEIVAAAKRMAEDFDNDPSDVIDHDGDSAPPSDSADAYGDIKF